MPNPAETSAPNLGDVLLHQGLIGEAQLQKLRARQNETGLSLGRLAVEERMIGEKTLMSVLQMTYGIEPANLEENPPDTSVALMIPRVIMEKYNLYPIGRDAKTGTLKIVMQDPSDNVILDAIRHQVKSDVRAFVATSSEIQNLLNPPKTGPKARAPKKRGIVYRVLRASMMPVLAFLPFPIFLGMMILNEDFNHTVLTGMPAGKWDLSIYVGLGWSLWALILFEINGLIFGRSEDDEE